MSKENLKNIIFCTLRTARDLKFISQAQLTSIFDIITYEFDNYREDESNSEETSTKNVDFAFHGVHRN